MRHGLRIGRFLLRPVERQLLADGQPAKLGARAFDLLQVLAEHAGQTVARGDLLDRVWPGRVVEDQNLQVHVVALRKLLGADAIATITGQGYRLTLPVQAEPPEAKSGAAGGVPALLQPLYGRGDDVEAVERLLCAHRLVSVTGPGGMGKTRLAEVVAARRVGGLADGMVLVELAALTEGSSLCATVARALGMTASQAQSSPPGLAQALQSLSLLLVLDNCEHVLDAAGALAAAVLAFAPKVQLLATSQAPLKVAGERVYRLGPLPLPAPGQRRVAGADDAVALFVARAQSLDAGFALAPGNEDAVTDICRRLDGIPLAIELAAARLPLLGAAGLRERLDARLRLLIGGVRDAPTRQQTLRGAFDWSHGLLEPGARAVFRRLALFHGSFSLDAAQQVAADEGLDAWAVMEHLGALVDLSLVQRLPGDEPRCRLLDSARSYALERLDLAGELPATRTRLAHAMLRLFEAADARYLGAPTLPWVERLMPDLDNLREALTVLLGPHGDAGMAVALAGSSGSFWLAAGLAAEGARRLEPVAALVGDSTPPRDAARYWLALAGLSASWAIPTARAFEAAQQALALFRAQDDREGTYRALSHYLSLAERLGVPVDEAALLAQMRSLEDPERSALQCRARRWAEAMFLGRQGRWDERRQLLLDEVRLLAEAGDERGSWLASHMLALTEVVLDRPAAAADLMEPVLTSIRSRGLLHRHWAQAAMLALACIEMGDCERAMPAVREALRPMRVEGTLWWLSDHLAWLVAQRGDMVGAACLHGWADARLQAQGERRGVTMWRARRALDALLAGRLAAADLERLRARGSGWPDERAVAVVLGEAMPSAGGGA